MGFSKQQVVNNTNNAVASLMNAIQSQIGRNRSGSQEKPSDNSSASLRARSRAYNYGGSPGRRPNDSPTPARANPGSNPGSLRFTGAASGAVSDAQAGGRVSAPSSSNRSRLTTATEGYDAAQGEKAQQQTEEQQQLEESTAGDNFKADFEAYSDANLGGMGISDFMRVDPNSQEDKDAWRAMVEDETMSAYYDDLIAKYGGFDPYWDAMTANSLSDVLEDDALQTQYFGSGDITQDIMEQLEYEGYLPAITGDTSDQAEIAALLAADPQAAADLMTYNYRQNLAGLLAQDVASGNMTEEDARGILSLDEYNELGDYGNMQYGYGDGYDMSATGFDPATFEVNGAISANDWNRSIEKGYTSLPGYGLADLGDDRALANYLYHAGYQEQEGVPELWASYYGEDTGEEEQQ